MAKRSRYGDDSTTTAPVAYPANLPFPTAIDATFPSRPYRTRRGEIKSAVHWGQRKLLLSEVQLLIEALEAARTRDTKFIIVYAGSAPGTHLRFLDELFPGQAWDLIDPIPFDTDALGDLPNFTLRNMYFTCAVASAYVCRRISQGGCPALAAVFGAITTPDGDDASAADGASAARGGCDGELNLIDGVEAVGETTTPADNLPAGLTLLLRTAAARTPLLFICDIRSGSVTEQQQQQQQQKQPSNGDADATEPAAETGESAPFRGVEFEQHVAADMTAQMLWVEYLQPTFALLKFRLPYMELYHPITKQLVHQHPSATTEYLSGKVLLPIWTRPTSTECRLLVPEGARRVHYDNRRYEEQCFFFNTVMRERMHFPHVLGGDAPAASYLDHRYDGAAEVHLLERYLRVAGIDIDAHTPAVAAVEQEGEEEEGADASGALLGHAGPSAAEHPVLTLSRRISAALGKTFEQAASRLPAVQLRKANSRGHANAMQQLLQRAEAHGMRRCWWGADVEGEVRGQCDDVVVAPGSPWDFLAA